MWTNGVFPSRNELGLTPRKALSLPTVYRAVSILSNVCADQPLIAYRDGQVLDPQPRLVTRPDPDRTYADFVSRFVTSMALHGEAFVRVVRESNRNQVLLFEVLDPNEVEPTWTNSGVKRYTHSTEGKAKDYPDAIDVARTRGSSAVSIYHARMLHVPGEVHGLGPIQACRLSLNSHLNTLSASDSFLSDRSIPSGILRTSQETNQDDARALAESWEEMVSAPGAIGVMPPGMDYTVLSLKPADLQFLESVEFGVSDVARLFGIPGVFFGVGIDGNSMTYMNVTESNRIFLQGTLRSYMRPLEDLFTTLSPGAQTVTFDTQGLIGTDESELVNTLKTAVDAGLMTVNEARARLKLDPINDEATSDPAPTEDAA